MSRRDHANQATRTDPPPDIRRAPPAPADDWALFLDVDGSLLDLAHTPDAVKVPEGVLARLDALHARLDGALALVSGRAIVTLDTLFAPSRFNAAGLHGAEHRHAGVRSVASEAAPQLQRLHDDAMRLAAIYDGALVEHKGAAIALHWRQAPDAEHALQAFAAHSLSQLPGYRLQHGKQVVELLPENSDEGSADKGEAITTFLETPHFAGRVPVFAGDDLTDESGFEVVNARGGISVLVGDRSTSAARYRLRDPAAVRAWLGVVGAAQ